MCNVLEKNKMIKEYWNSKPEKHPNPEENSATPRRGLFNAFRRTERTQNNSNLPSNTEAEEMRKRVRKLEAMVNSLQEQINTIRTRLKV